MCHRGMCMWNVDKLWRTVKDQGFGFRVADQGFTVARISLVVVWYNGCKDACNDVKLGLFKN